MLQIGKNNYLRPALLRVHMSAIELRRTECKTSRSCIVAAKELKSLPASGPESSGKKRDDGRREGAWEGGLLPSVMGFRRADAIGGIGLCLKIFALIFAIRCILR